MTDFLTLSDITLSYYAGKKKFTTIESLNLKQNEFERVVIVGPSGCGKSTLLKAVAGFLPVDSGSIQLKGKDITAPGTDRIMVFQDLEQIFPWKTVLENIVFPLRLNKNYTKAEAISQAETYLEKVHLADFRHYYPHQLSGGMKQRTAIARALALKPEILLMDEPLGALDDMTRRKLQDELLHLWEDTKFSMLMVTHSIEEAVTLGDRIIVLSSNPGKIVGEFKAGEANLYAAIKERLKEGYLYATQ